MIIMGPRLTFSVSVLDILGLSKHASDLLCLSRHSGFPSALGQYQIRQETLRANRWEGMTRQDLERLHCTCALMSAAPSV
jgi:hypothetical protein